MTMLELADAPVDQPPVRRANGRPKGKFVIVPDICRAQESSRTLHDNCWTIHYRHMVRWWDDGRIEFAHANSRKYRQWLEIYETEAGIPPHISFGGAAVAGERDPEFYSRWVAFARETFC